jgi:hypothetical protein
LLTELEETPMKLTLRALLTGACLIALATVSVTAYPAFAEDLGVEFWGGPDWRTRLTESERRQRDLESAGAVILRRTAVRTELVNDLIAGRIQIDDAVRRFVELNRSSPETLERVRLTYPGNTHEERAAWQLVGHLRSRQTPQALALAEEISCGLAYRPVAR